MIDIKSIHFPPPVADDMVRAILEGRKTVTRRVVKAQEPDWELLGMDNDPYMTRIDRNGEEYPSQEMGLWAVFDWGAEFPMVKAPYQPGNILCVRETWAKIDGDYVFKADDESPEGWHLTAWYPSIHMPREAARIFLRVTDVRVERLKEIDDEEAKAEGSNWRNGKHVGFEEKMRRSAVDRFAEIWDSTINPADRALYGWLANPWVWVIAFERCEKPEGD